MESQTHWPVLRFPVFHCLVEGRSRLRPFVAPVFKAVVRGDDVLHEPVADDVTLSEPAEADALDAGEDQLRLFQPGRPAGKSIWVMSPVITAFEP